MGLIAYYLRVFFRSHTRPISKKFAEKGEFTSSVLYFLSAWAAFGVAAYAFAQNYEKNKDAKYSSGEAFSSYDAARKFGSIEKPTTIITIKGFSVEKEVLNPDDPKLYPEPGTI